MAAPPTPTPDVRPVPFREGLRTWMRIGLLSFGGPAGQIAVMQRILVDEKRWIGQDRFLHALNYCMLLPGPEATQLVTYIGWLMHRVWGGIAAGVLFVLPGFISILALSLIYAAYGDTPAVEAAFFGLKPAVLAIVLAAVIRIGRRALRGWAPLCIASTAFVAMFFFALPFPVVIAFAAAAGLLFGRFKPGSMQAKGLGSKGDHPKEGLIDQLATAGMLRHAEPSARKSLATLAIWGTLWWGPIALLAVLTGPSSVWTTLGVFFSKAAVVTFGGAYAVLAYLAQQAVEHYHWVTAPEMLDGLGMAETTPGPLIQVVQHVGFMAGVRDAGGLPPLLAGTLAAVLVTWVTFVPCFLWIFLGGPYVEALREQRSLRNALAGITAAVVGVVLNLAIWFALHVLFGTVGRTEYGPLRLWTPDPATLDWRAVVVAAVACFLVFAARWGTLAVLGASVVIGAVLWLGT